MNRRKPVRSFCRHGERTALSAIAAVIIVSSALANPAAQPHAEIKFIASQDGVPIEGGFKEFRADVELDPDMPAGGKVSIVIDTASVNTGSSDADGMLRGRDFFDVARFPNATFKSTSIIAEKAGTFRAIGQFSLKGRVLALDIPFSVRQNDAGRWFEGSVPVSRLAYKIGEGEWADTGNLADQVLIRFKVSRPEGQSVGQPARRD
jgi:polyisoprenoid-binding protein YceI